MIPLIQLFPTLAAGTKISGSSRQAQKLAAYEHGSFWMMDLAARHASPLLLKTAVPASFGEIHRSEAGLLAKAMQLPDEAQVYQRMAAGKRAFAAFVEGELAAYGWVSRSAECIGEIEHEIKLGVDEAYIWDCATLPAYRRLGLYSALLDTICAQLGWEGQRRAWIGSSLANRPSLLGFAKAGFRPVIHMLYLRLFTLSLMWVSAAPAASQSLVASGRQVLSGGWADQWGPLSIDYRSSARTLPSEGSSCSGSLGRDVDIPQSESISG